MNDKDYGKKEYLLTTPSGEVFRTLCYRKVLLLMLLYPGSRVLSSIIGGDQN